MRPLLLGHRGSRGASVRENTFSAFDLALQHGSDGFEFDVRVTSDGIAVVCHNPTFQRARIAARRYDQLQKLERLDVLLRRYRQTAFLDIELKSSGVEENLLELLAQYPPSKGFVISSFLPEVLLCLRGMDRNLPLGLIAKNHRQLRKWRELPVEYVIVHYSLLSQTLVKDVHRASRKLFSWTVNSPRDMRRLAAWGVDGLISDRTDLLVRTLRPDPESD